MDSTSESPAPDELERLRAERDEWRRRAEVAEAIAAERLLRAETAERALAPATSTTPEQVTRPPRPRSLLERWRRYTDTIN